MRPRRGVFGPFSGDRGDGVGVVRVAMPSTNSSGAAGNQDETQGEKTRGLANQRPRQTCGQASGAPGPARSTRPDPASPRRVWPHRSTTIAARGSRPGCASFTPSTSRSRASRRRSSVYITGDDVGHPRDRPSRIADPLRTPGSRARRREHESHPRLNHSSGKSKTGSSRRESRVRDHAREPLERLDGLTSS